MRKRAGALFIIAFGLFALFGTQVQAQDTNLAILQQLARECLGELPNGVDSLALEAPDQMPYLRAALVESWKSDGREVYTVDASPAQAAHLPRLAFTIEDAGVDYLAAGRRDLNREVRLALQYSLTGADGRIILDERCAQAYSDTVDRSAIAGLETEAHAETKGELPRAGLLRRIIEPAVITAATAIGVYLFFTLRSQSADE